MADNPLAALAGMAGPASPSTEPVPLEPTAEAPGGPDPEAEDKMMLLEDFRMAPPEDALAAFEALLSAFGVKRS